MTRYPLLRLLLITLLLIATRNVLAVEMRHNFTLTGDGGETGSGYFTWDDAVALDGIELNIVDIIESTITINGGATPGGTQTFVLADWTNSSLQNTPNFLIDINLVADNGAETLAGAFFYNADASWGSVITFAPGATVPAVAPVAAARSIPSLNVPGLILISLLIAMTGIWQLHRITVKQTL
jgi:hypothetical protein